MRGFFRDTDAWSAKALNRAISSGLKARSVRSAAKRTPWTTSPSRRGTPRNASMPLELDDAVEGVVVVQVGLRQMITSEAGAGVLVTTAGVPVVAGTLAAETLRDGTLHSPKRVALCNSVSSRRLSHRRRSLRFCVFRTVQQCRRLFSTVPSAAPGKAVVLTALITLVAVTGHQNTTPARILVRPLSADDLPELASLHREIYADDTAQQRGGDPDRIRTSPDGGRNPVAEAASLVASGPGGQITAAIIITERDGEAIIDQLFTHPDHRRQGLAEELLRHCLYVLHTLGISTVSVTIDENNSAALALYLSRDFRRPTDDDAECDYD